MMNLEKLEVGMVVKNYKGMCELLGEKVKGGDSKKSQIKEWDRYFSYKKDGNKFVIESIHNEVKDKEDNRVGKSVYSDMIELILMDILSRNKGKLLISKSKLTRELGLVNDNYSLGYGNQLKMSKYLEIDIDYVKDFYHTSSSNLSGIVNNAIKSLEKKKLIDCNLVTVVKSADEKYPRVATDIERMLIQSIERICLDEIGLKEADFKGRDSNYYKFTNMRNSLLKEKYNIENVYKAFDIVFNFNHLEKAKNDLSIHILDELSRKNNIKELNTIFSDNVNKSAIKRHENYTSSQKLLLIRFSNVYVPYFEKMVSELIKINAEHIEYGTLINVDLNDDIDSSLPF